MKQLIIQELDNKQVISARELYENLEIKERFSYWFSRMVGYGFTENEDFIGCMFFNTLAKQELKDYKISLDMAKQICMLQRSEKGKQYREYLLKVEMEKSILVQSKKTLIF